MTKSELDYFDSILIGPGMLFMNQYFNTFINEYIVLWLCLVSITNYIRFSYACRTFFFSVSVDLYTFQTNCDSLAANN